MRNSRGDLPACRGASVVERWRDELAEVSRGHSSSERPGRRPEHVERTDARISTPKETQTVWLRCPNPAQRVAVGNRESIGRVRQTARQGENVRPEELQLMETVVARENLLDAYRRVMSNKGAAGVDEMPVERLLPYLQEHWAQIKESLLKGTYQPQAVRCVEIPKPNGGVRQLGIPTVMDRLIQQALHQVLSPLVEPDFSESSYGFRPGRSAKQAVSQARAYVAEGRRWIVDLDLENFFDRVNHDVLMSRLARRISDKRVLGLIRRNLQAGMMAGGVVSPRAEGTPQGGPLSPLLSNILLGELDKELERRGHKFCRYADDCTSTCGEGCGRTGDEVGTWFLSERPRFEGQRGEKCSRPPVGAKVSGLLDDVAQAAAIESSAGIHPAAEGEGADNLS
jgi:retron-type reverse transcriptase